MKTCWIRLTVFVLAGWLLVASAGCAPTKKEMKVSAEAHWKRMRSGMMLQMAQQQFDTGDLDQSEKTLNNAMAADAANPQLYTLAGRIALERGQLERAYHLLDQAIQIDNKLPEPHYYQAIVFQRWQQYDKALDQYQQAFAHQPDNVGYLLAIAEMHVALDQTDKALSLLTSKMTYFDQNAGIRVGIAQIHMMKGQYAQAADYFQKAVLLDPEDPSLVEDLAAAQLAAGRVGDAIDNLRRLIASPGYTDRADLQRTLAHAYVQAQQFDQARQIYQKLTRKDPNDAESWLGLAQAAWAKGDRPAALAAAQRAINAAPQQPEAYILAGTVLQSRQQWPQALRMFDRAAQLAPKQATPIVLRGVAYEGSGQLPKAIQDYRAALVLEPANDRARQLLDHALAQATP